MFCSISGELLVEEVGQVSLAEGAAGTPTALTSQGSLLCLLQGGELGPRTSYNTLSLKEKFSLDRRTFYENSAQEINMCGCQKYDSAQTQRC